MSRGVPVSELDSEIDSEIDNEIDVVSRGVPWCPVVSYGASIVRSPGVPRCPVMSRGGPWCPVVSR
eukprot:1431121-Pyramimonas_sp.AAC.1